MSTAILGFIIIFGLVVIIGLIGIIYEPMIAISSFNIIPRTFRLYKPKNEGQYYLQVRVFYLYYYIYKSKDNYSLQYSSDNHCIFYSTHVINSKRNKIFDDRYEVVKFFNDTGSPKDIINL